MKVTEDEIARLLASGTPRVVPPHIARATQGGCIAWILPLFGFCFALFGLFAAKEFFPWRFQAEGKLNSAAAQVVPGVITAVIPTKVSINDAPIISYRFRYEPPDGRVYEGTCFTNHQRWTQGAAVTVRYLPETPAVACPVGGRLSKASGFDTLVFVFPLAGLGFIAWFLVARNRAGWLLREGALTEVKVLAVDATRMSVNYQTVYAITVSSPDLQGGVPVTVKRWQKPDINLATARALRQEPVFVLYDPRKPARLLFPEALIET